MIQTLTFGGRGHGESPWSTYGDLYLELQYTGVASTVNDLTSWIGYKLQPDVADGGILVRCVLTAASVHDSQVAIPLATMTSERTRTPRILESVPRDLARSPSETSATTDPPHQPDARTCCPAHRPHHPA